jgi:ribosomal protein S18 acetylase RimI-like enzyme
MQSIAIRPLGADDKDWVKRFAEERWGSDMMVARGTVYYVSDLAGFVAVQGDEKIGLITYRIAGDSCEVGSLDSVRPSIGVGTALIKAVEAVARQAGCRRIWLITTNDNMNALRFYQKRGFVLVAIHRNAIEQARKIKPQISMLGEDGIPLRDEIELEMTLA